MSNLEVEARTGRQRTLLSRLTSARKAFSSNSSSPTPRASGSQPTSGGDSLATPVGQEEIPSSSSSSPERESALLLLKTDQINDDWVEFRISELDALIERFLDGRGCVLWGEQHSITDAKGRPKAHAFLKKTVLELFEANDA